MSDALLDHQLCVAVYRAAHAFTGAYRSMLQPHGLTYPQYVLLMALWDRSPQTVSDLGGVLDLDSGTLSPLLRRLQDAGLVIRSRSARDGRVVEVALTEQGRAMRAETEHVRREIVACTRLTVDDGMALLSGLHSLTHNLRRSPEPASA
ncbi:MarR family winged helix-turn-helix transcriptional regulator [Nakamurella leprariae]|uniref:MarR family transcriptional regulator n=1 Tax=Nakamurella leprariae TaxID=2803911 RepID=A0A938YB93_9ACTN|nr:MarR family transcriptional regulator [Nakamurella leprariae]MBM9466416.1 MarR family transcriptional regulator [Nakamurella leprariae]